MLHAIIKKRVSPRAFSDKQLSVEQVYELFEAARWAPSSRNEQPWRFIYAERCDEDSFNKMTDILFENNRIWAKNAPLLILTAAKLDTGVTGQLNKYAFHDLGLAVANLTFQANSNDLYVHQMGGFNAEKARILFEIPENYEPVSVLAVGYKGNPDSLPEVMRVRENAPRTRKELDDIVFKKKFGVKNKKNELLNC